MGCDSVRGFSEGRAALNALSDQKDTQFIILDWKLKDVNALAVAQRLRENPQNAFLPILITSGLISKEDFCALGEFPCMGFLEKPFSKANLEAAITKVWKESAWYTVNQNEISKVFNDVTRNGQEKAQFYLKIIASCPKPQPLILAASRYLRENGNIDAAAKLLIDGLITYKNDPSLMGELGKIHFINGDLMSAKQCVEKSLHYRPENIKRLIFAGEVNLNLDNPEEAKKYFNKALRIDEENQ